MNDKEVLMKFLKMPLGRADEIFDEFSHLAGAEIYGSGLKKFLFIRGSRENRVLMVAHGDTYWDEAYVGSCAVNGAPGEIYEEDGVIKNRNGCLGADDRAGCAIVWLLKYLGHSILITSGEEHGRKGSNYLMEEHPEIANEINSNHQFIVQFDRRNGWDFKCYTVGTEEFRAYVRKKTGFNEPDRNSATDIVTLCRSVCGVNLSVGYDREHSEGEYLVPGEWENTLNIARGWFSEPELPRFDLPDRSSL